MISHLLIRIVHVPVIQNRAVIGSEENQSFISQTPLLKGLHQSAHLPVQLRHHISARAKRSASFKPFMNNPRDMDIDRRIEDEERIVRHKINKVNQVSDY